MMDAVNDLDTETVVIMSSAQIGKTELLNNVLGYYIDHEPSPILLLQPTVEMSQTWSKDRLSPMLRDTPALRGKVREARSRDSGNTILHKSFEGGHITMAGANSPASLASRPIRIVLCDEVDRYPASAGKEGDPVSLAKKRTKTFWNKKIILTSTPTIEGHSRIETEFNLSDQRYYHVPCPHCGEKQRLRWANVQFDKEDANSTYYACEHNGCVIEEKDKQWMLENGEWIASAPFNGRAGFHLSELYSPWSKWSDVVKDFLEMKGDADTLKTWTNTSLGETWKEKSEGVTEIEGLLERRENYDADSLPDDILLITAAVDVQGNRLEFLSQGWGENYEHWDIEHIIFYGDPADREVWVELDKKLKHTYNVNGSGMKIACAAIDSGGHHTDQVYNFCKPRSGRRIFAIRGSSQYYSPVASKPTQAGRQRVPLYSIGTDSAKDTIILSWLSAKPDETGHIHFPHDHDEELFSQLIAEQRRTKISHGKKRLEWVPTRERNEMIDLHVYNYGAYAILSPDIGALISKRNKKAPVDDPVEPHRPTKRRRPVKKRRNWATNIND